MQFGEDRFLSEVKVIGLTLFGYVLVVRFSGPENQKETDYSADGQDG